MSPVCQSPGSSESSAQLSVMSQSLHYCSTFVDYSSQRSPSPGPNHVASSSSNAPNSASAPPTASAARPSCSFTPTLAAHFNENLIKHVQGWPAEHAEKQVCTTYITFIYMIELGKKWLLRQHSPSSFLCVSKNDFKGIKTT